jgi:hypothetical protein
MLDVGYTVRVASTSESFCGGFAMGDGADGWRFLVPQSRSKSCSVGNDETTPVGRALVGAGESSRAVRKNEGASLK